VHQNPNQTYPKTRLICSSFYYNTKIATKIHQNPKKSAPFCNLPTFPPGCVSARGQPGGAISGSIPQSPEAALGATGLGGIVRWMMNNDS
jgi:hypothetical protein